MLFEGFRLERIDTGEGALRVRIGGEGPPLLLLHGNPQTHMIWHKVAPALARRFTLVCPDLRGYGESHKPAPSADHAPYAKRAMAAELVALMEGLGFMRFRLAGHDRGGRVAHRLALDHPARVERLAVLDIIPTLEHFERTDMDFAMGYYHWFFLAQPHPLPETLIGAAADAWFASHVRREPKGDDFFHPAALADYLAAVHHHGMVGGMCEDYRAAATIDLVHDRASRAAGQVVVCPTLALWGAKGKIGRWYKPLEVWREYCESEATGGGVSGGEVASGHYLAEEAPGEVLDWFAGFFG